jgi:hypothetical protein
LADDVLHVGTENPVFVYIAAGTGLKMASIPLNDTNAQRMRL